MFQVNSLEILELIICRKKRAELVFRKGYLLWKGSPNERIMMEIDTELNSTEEKLKELEKKLCAFTLVLPDQNKLDELNKKLSSFDKEKLYEAMRDKEGEVFELIKERGELLKEIYLRKEEIAKLNFLSNGLKGKENISSLMKDKENFSDSSLLKIKDKKMQKELLRLFKRIGFKVSKENLTIEEEKVPVGSKYVWVPVAMISKIKDLNKNLEELSRKIQYTNAQKQIKEFSDSEEKEFQSMQSKYLSLLKEQDKILTNFDDL